MLFFEKMKKYHPERSAKRIVEGSWQLEDVDVTGAEGADICVQVFGAKILRRADACSG